jgi:hypothetical protein
MKTSGQGTLAVSGFGSIHELEVRPDHPILVDNGHLVAWDSSLKYEVALNTAHKGLFGSMVQSVVSGAMVVLRFSGRINYEVSEKRNQKISVCIPCGSSVGDAFHCSCGARDQLLG